jgi:molybdate transport repressor ModE-like protein
MLDRPHDRYLSTFGGEANWDLFRLFIAVANSGSVNAAARDLGMSQPTLSRRLKELENYVGAPLFFRVSSGMKLTREGEEVRRASREIVETFDHFHRELRLRVSPRSSTVKISTTEGMTKHWLLPRVRKLYDVNPKVRLDINSTLQQEDLATSDLDFVIRIGAPGKDDLVGRRVATMPFGIFSSRSYLARRGVPRTIAEIKGHDIIGNSGDFAGFRGERAGRTSLLTQFYDAAEADYAVHVTPIAHHYSAAAEGLGLACLAVPFAEAEGLTRVLPHEAFSLDVWLLRRKESDLRKTTRQVGRFLENEFSASKRWFSESQPTQTLTRETA